MAIVKINGEWKHVPDGSPEALAAQAQPKVGGPIPTKLGDLGGSFKLANEGVTPRLIVAVDALEKQGKTHFALTAPGPIAYQSTDIGLEGVIQKFQSAKKIFVAEYGFTVSKQDSQQELMAKAEGEWTRFVKDYRDVLIPGFKSGALRTGVWDTGSELWEFERLARVGKLTQVMPHHYTALNQEYTQLIKEVYGTSGNLIILHKLKAEWKDNPTTGKGGKTGAYERSGFAGTGFLVQVNVTAWRDTEGEFHITVKDCRQNPSIAGQDFVGPLAAFPYLAQAVYPQTQLEDWQ